MKYAAPLGSTNPDAPFVNGNAAQGIKGSIPTAASFNGPQREIVNAIELSGQIQNADDNTQLWQAIQRAAASNWALDQSITAGKIVIALPTAYRPGLPLLVKVALDNPGTTLTLQALGQAEKVVTLNSGKAITPGTVRQNGIYFFGQDTDLNWQLLTGHPVTAETAVLHFGVAGGTANALTATLAPTISGYAAGMVAILRVNVDNTGAATFDGGFGAVAIKKLASAALAAADLKGSGIAILVHDGTNWVLTNLPPGTSGGGSATNVDITQLLAAYPLTVLSATTTTPPGSPANGDAYLIPAAGATGAWLGHGNQVAQLVTGTGWVFRDYPAGAFVMVAPAGGQLADVLERTASGWSTKFATAGSVATGTATKDIVSSKTLHDALAGVTAGTGYAYLTSNTTLVGGVYYVDTSAGPITLTLPASPTGAVAMLLIDAAQTWDVNPPTLARNGGTIAGLAEDCLLNIRDAAFSLRRAASATDWRAF